jgi:hypothetical protein
MDAADTLRASSEAVTELRLPSFYAHVSKQSSAATAGSSSAGDFKQPQQQQQQRQQALPVTALQYSQLIAGSRNGSVAGSAASTPRTSPGGSGLGGTSSMFPFDAASGVAVEPKG